MADKKYASRVQHKSGTTSEWELATNFKPLEGELLVYTDAGGTNDSGKAIPQLKIGDGTTLVANLPFVGSKETEHADKADTATNADHATTSDTATNATHATSADKAGAADVAVKTEKAITFKRDGTTLHSFDGSVARTVNFKEGNNVTLSSDTSGNLTINATDTTYSAASATLGLVKSGGDVTVTDGVITVNDDSHNHTIDNVNNLQTTLDSINTAIEGKSDSGHTHSSYVNQNAFSNVSVGSTTIAADKATDTLTLVAGSNITLTPDATNDKITIAATDTVYTHPTHSSAAKGLYKVEVDSQGHVSSTTAVTKSDITALGIPSTNTTYSAATSSALGLVKSGGDVTVATDGTMTVTDDSHNHVINNVDGLQTALDGKSDSGHTHTSYVNQNAFSNVKVGDTTISADSITDTLTLTAGSNVTLTPDATGDGVTISATDTVYTHPTHSAKSSGLYKVTVDSTGHVSAATAYSDKYHKTGTWSGLTYTATAVGSADALAFTIPTGTTATTVAVGNHTHDSRYYTETEVDAKFTALVIDDGSID